MSEEHNAAMVRSAYDLKAALDPARLGMFRSLGVNEIKYREFVADGQGRIVALVEPSGMDGNGERWSMPLVEFFTVKYGIIIETRPFWWDVAELSRVARSWGVDTA